jgi:A/G-specific adenine glycosylase
MRRRMNAAMGLREWYRMSFSPNFSKRLIAWQRRHGRHDLPWQGTRDPYRIWLSEIMLQQTQVSAVVPYYERFLQRFPSVAALAAAREDDVLRLWSGLGYYARGRNLHKAARLIVEQGFPSTQEAIAQLPGIGRSTAGAIAAFAFGARAAILDGNVKRVLSRVFAVEEEGTLWALAERLLPARDIETYTQALMDLGATLCARRNPRCSECPVKAECLARKQGATDRFPAPRVKRALPVRKVTWWLITKDKAILMEKRPSAGLWGGLLAFPETIERGWRITSRRKLPVVEHGFTHFRLVATPVLCQATVLRLANGHRWFAIKDAIDEAVPTPVRNVLRELRVRALSPN